MAIDTTIATPQQANPRPIDPDTSAVAGLVDPVRSRRSWRYTAGAIAAILTGGLLSVAIYTSSQHSESVFIVSSNIDRGAPFTAAKLTTISLDPGQRIDGYTPDQARQIIGKIAAVTLPAGSLITHAAVTDHLPVPTGQAVVGIAVKPTQMPAIGLTAGDQIVITPVASQTATLQQRGSQPDDVPATVTAPPSTDPTSGLVIVDVTVPTSAASDVAGRAAAGQVTIYLTGGSDR